MLERIGVVKNFQIWAKFSTRLNCLDFAHLHLKFEHNSTKLKFLDFAKFHILKDRGDQKFEIWTQFSTQLKFLHFPKFYVLQDQSVQIS